MNVLALETSWKQGSVALFEDDEQIQDQQLQEEHAHGRRLAPAVLEVLKNNRLSSQDLDLIAVDVGPGSYTGLRVGVSFAKTLAYAEEIPVTTVTSCDAIADEAPVTEKKLCVVIDAQWNEVYMASYERRGGAWERNSSIQTLSPGDLTEYVDRKTLLLGNGIREFESLFEETGASIGASSSWYPEAHTIGRLGYRSYESGQEAELVSLQPLYLRPTQADVDRN